MNTGLDIFSHPRSMRLLAGTNEYAEDLTGQRAPMNASQWRSETQVCTYLRNGECTHFLFRFDDMSLLRKGLKTRSYFLRNRFQKIR